MRHVQLWPTRERFIKNGHDIVVHVFLFHEVVYVPQISRIAMAISTEFEPFVQDKFEFIY